MDSINNYEVHETACRGIYECKSKDYEADTDSGEWSSSFYVGTGNSREEAVANYITHVLESYEHAAHMAKQCTRNVRSMDSQGRESEAAKYREDAEKFAAESRQLMGVE